MNLAAEIGLITVPQEFVRLCNAVLIATYGDDFLPIDDDRADRGNDGYLRSEKRLFAAHCFKRIQNQSLDKEIREKMVSDLRKAITLKSEGAWDIQAWTFISNYPVSEAIATHIILIGNAAQIAVSWRGPEYLAVGLQEHESIREQFPDLHVSDVSARLALIQDKLGVLPIGQTVPKQASNTHLKVPRTTDQQRELLLVRPPAWEYLLFAGVLYQGKEHLEPKWHDHEMRFARRSWQHLDDSPAVNYISSMFGDISSAIAQAMKVFTPESQAQAFGEPGEPGNPVRIEHFARHIITAYEELLDWSATIRSVGVSDTLQTTYELAARVADQPARDIRGFVDRVVAETDRVPELLANHREEEDESITISLSLVLTVDDDAIDAFLKELKHVERRLG